jgi:putative tricarboxylic transport membrane protein
VVLTANQEDTKKVHMKKYDVIGGLFFLSMGILFAIYARSVDIGTWDEPGPGFLPFWAGLLLIAMSVILIVRSFMQHEKESGSFFPESTSWKRVSAVVGAMIAYNLLLKPLGFTIVTFIFVAFLVKFIFPQGWLKTVIAASFSTLGARLIFINLLGIQFPKGFLGF